MRDIQIVGFLIQSWIPLPTAEIDGDEEIESLSVTEMAPELRRELLVFRLTEECAIFFCRSLACDKGSRLFQRQFHDTAPERPHAAPSQSPL